MKFIEKYPESQHHQEFNQENGRKIIKCFGSSLCFICKESSYFIDGRLMVCLCSDECQKKVWEGLDEEGNKKQL